MDYIQTSIYHSGSVILIYLLETYYDLLTQANKLLILQRVIDTGRLPLLKYLMENLGYKYLRNIEDIIPYAARSGTPDIMRYVLDNIRTDQQTKNNALIIARDEDRIANIDLLRKYGAKDVKYY